MQKENLTKISGTVENIIYKNEETGFAVLELDHDGEPLTVVGELAAVGEGETLILHGSYRTHPSYGTQFRAVAAEQQLPATASACGTWPPAPSRASVRCWPPAWWRSLATTPCRCWKRNPNA